MNFQEMRTRPIQLRKKKRPSSVQLLRCRRVVLILVRNNGTQIPIRVLIEKFNPRNFLILSSQSLFFEESVQLISNDLFLNETVSATVTQTNSPEAPSRIQSSEPQYNYKVYLSLKISSEQHKKFEANFRDVLMKQL